MVEGSEIACLAAEYEQLRKLLRRIAEGGGELSEELLDQESALTRQLITLPAATGAELAQKALVLLDWVPGHEDVPSELTLSLCYDAVRIFLPGASAVSPDI